MRRHVKTHAPVREQLNVRVMTLALCEIGNLVHKRHGVPKILALPHIKNLRAGIVDCPSGNTREQLLHLGDRQWRNTTLARNTVSPREVSLHRSSLFLVKGLQGGDKRRIRLFVKPRILGGVGHRDRKDGVSAQREKCHIVRRQTLDSPIACSGETSV